MKKSFLPYAMLLCMVPCNSDNTIIPNYGRPLSSSQQRLSDYFVQRNANHIYAFKSDGVPVYARVEEGFDSEEWLVFFADIGKKVEVRDTFTRMREKENWLPNGILDWSDSVMIEGEKISIQKARRMQLDQMIKKWYEDAARSLD
ncbi:hypothetical protein JXB27_02275 [Candidatus Woesearchaeota archaeon]|nr:hypothetical protein [Candidatus Woesearchaeota archaeon]